MHGGFFSFEVGGYIFNSEESRRGDVSGLVALTTDEPLAGARPGRFTIKIYVTNLSKSDIPAPITLDTVTGLVLEEQKCVVPSGANVLRTGETATITLTYLRYPGVHFALEDLIPLAALPSP